MRHNIFNRNRNYIILENITVSKARRLLKNVSGISCIVLDKNGVRLYYTTKGLTKTIRKAIRDSGAIIQGSHPASPDLKRGKLVYKTKQESTKTFNPTIKSMAKDLAKSGMLSHDSKIITDEKEVIKVCNNDIKIVTYYWQMLPEDKININRL